MVGRNFLGLTGQLLWIAKLGVQLGLAPFGVLSKIVHSGIKSGAPRESWPGSDVSPPISPLQKWRMLPSPCVKTLKAGISASSAFTYSRVKSPLTSENSLSCCHVFTSFCNGLSSAHPERPIDGA